MAEEVPDTGAQSVRDVLLRVSGTLEKEPDATELRDVRALLDEPAFYSELSDYLKGVNDALEKANILS